MNRYAETCEIRIQKRDCDQKCTRFESDVVMTATKKPAAEVRPPGREGEHLTELECRSDDPRIKLNEAVSLLVKCQFI